MVGESALRNDETGRELLVNAMDGAAFGEHDHGRGRRRFAIACLRVLGERVVAGEHGTSKNRGDRGSAQWGMIQLKETG
jgi:hypothetical protein